MRISGIFFALVIISFLLPFFLVTCNGTKLATYTGLQILTGSEGSKDASNPVKDLQKSIKGLEKAFDASEDVQEQSGSEGSKSKSSNFNFPAALALLMAIAGLICAYALNPKKYRVTLIIAILGIVFLILLTITVKAKISKAQQEMQGMIEVALKFQYGYYLAILGFILAAAFSVMFKKREPIPVAEGSGYAPYQEPLTDDMIEPSENESIEAEIEEDAPEETPPPDE